MAKIRTLQDWIHEKIIKSDTQSDSCKLKERVKDDYEVCVCCGKQLTMLKTTPIDIRMGYIEGSGQLCIDCFGKLYHSK